MEDMRSYLRWKVEEAQAKKARRKEIIEKIGCVLTMMAFAA